MDQNIPFSQWPEVPDYDMGEPFYQEGVKWTTRHNFELEKCGYTVACVDAFQNGIGSNSCGPELAKRYESPADIHFACTLAPYRGDRREK